MLIYIRVTCIYINILNSEKENVKNFLGTEMNIKSEKNLLDHLRKTIFLAVYSIFYFVKKKKKTNGCCFYY